VLVCLAGTTEIRLAEKSQATSDQRPTTNNQRPASQPASEPATTSQLDHLPNCLPAACCLPASAHRPNSHHHSFTTQHSPSSCNFNSTSLLLPRNPESSLLIVSRRHNLTVCSSHRLRVLARACVAKERGTMLVDSALAVLQVPYTLVLSGFALFLFKNLLLLVRQGTFRFIY
jgi:hypothetical protein